MKHRFGLTRRRILRPFGKTRLTDPAEPFATTELPLEDIAEPTADDKLPGPCSR